MLLFYNDSVQLLPSVHFRHAFHHKVYAAKTYHKTDVLLQMSSTCTLYAPGCTVRFAAAAAAPCPPEDVRRSKHAREAGATFHNERSVCCHCRPFSFFADVFVLTLVFFRLQRAEHDCRGARRPHGGFGRGSRVRR